MKKLLFIFFAACFTNIQAQTASSFTAEVDFRIYIDHTQQQVNDLIKNNPLEIKKLNHYYEKSFIIIPSSTPGAPAVDVSLINVKRFEEQRLENERTTILISANDDKLVLKSKNELEKEYQLIK